MKYLLIGSLVVIAGIIGTFSFLILTDKGMVFPKQPHGAFMYAPYVITENGSHVVRWVLPEECTTVGYEVQEVGYTPESELLWGGMGATCAEGNDTFFHCRAELHPDMHGRISEWLIQASAYGCSDDRFYVSGVTRVTDDPLIGAARYNCELSAGIFENGRCICPIDEGVSGQTQETQYDKNTGFCQSTIGGPIGDAFNASSGLPYGEYDYWTGIILGLCTESGGEISGVACICPSDKAYSKLNGKCE